MDKKDISPGGCWTEKCGDLDLDILHEEPWVSPQNPIPQIPTSPSNSTPQPPPIKNNLPGVWGLLIKDMQDRDSFGIKKYKTKLQPFNGRDTLKDALQEALDLCVYLRTLIYERDGQ